MEQTGAAIRAVSQSGGARVEARYLLSGAESKYQAGAETRNSAVKWEGAALLINTLVSVRGITSLWIAGGSRRAWIRWWSRGT